MRNIAVIILSVFILLSVGFYSEYKNNDIQPTPTPTPTSISIPSSTSSPTFNPTPTITPTPQKQPDAIIGPGESAKVPCGDGNGGSRVVFPVAQNGFATNVGRGDQTETTISVIDNNGQPSGGLIEWRLYYWGELSIDGCNATFTAPDSIGTAYSVSATIHAKVVTQTPSQAPTTIGEGGPINAGYVASTKITILSGSSPTCHDPEGVSVSINSVDTTRNVQIVIDTPRFQGRVFNGRNATVRDGEGMYYIQYFVDGALYDETESFVRECRLEVIRR